VTRTFLIAAAISFAGGALGAQQSTAHDQLTRGKALWDQRLSKSAIEALQTAARDPAVAADAHETLARIYAFKGWQQESTFPGWHDEPEYRARAIEEMKAALAADPQRQSAQLGLRTLQSLEGADAVDPAMKRPEVRVADARIELVRTKQPEGHVRELLALIMERTKVQADPAPYFLGAEIMIERGAYDPAIQLAERGITVSDRFINENLGAYQMEGKAEAAHRRGRATGADLVGWALVQKKAYARAKTTLEEAERLWPAPDFSNQYHLAELARLQGDTASARDHYLNALSLAGGPAPLREEATTALSKLYSDTDTPPAKPFDAWLESELSKRRDARKDALLKSLVDKPLPKLTLTTVDGKPYDIADLRGKVVLLDFFASWCGVCRAELPHLKTAYQQYTNDPSVAFLLVSIDDDSKRLERYLHDMQFAFPVARASKEDMERAMGFNDVPATFYLDRDGVVRYQIIGTEAHGDSPKRVSWFIDELKRARRAGPARH
jgi:thiol-disulfide isomerase/thioredoxin